MAAVFVSMVLNALVAGIFPGERNHELARAIGEKLPWLFVLAAATSYAFQVRLRWVPTVGLIVTLTGVVGPALLLIVLSLSQIPELEEAAYIPMVEAGATICHEHLPLSFAALGPEFVRDSAAEAKLRASLDPKKSVAWTWTNSQAEERVILHYFRGSGETAPSFERYTDGLLSGIAESGDVVVDEERLSTDSWPFTYSLGTTFPGGVALDVFCRSVKENSGPIGVACIQTVAASHKALLAVRDSFQGHECQ